MWPSATVAAPPDAADDYFDFDARSCHFDWAFETLDRPSSNWNHLQSIMIANCCHLPDIPLNTQNYTFLTKFNTKEYFQFFQNQFLEFLYFRLILLLKPKKTPPLALVYLLKRNVNWIYYCVNVLHYCAPYWLDGAFRDQAKIVSKNHR